MLANEVFLRLPTGLHRLDLSADTVLRPNYAANDRLKPDTVQATYTAEFSVPGTSNNYSLLGHAAQAQNTTGRAYSPLAAVVTSGGVEILPNALLYVKAYANGQGYQLQLFGGNRRLAEALGGGKMLSDLDFSRFNHTWNPRNVLAGLTDAHYRNLGWGYSLVDRGKPIFETAAPTLDNKLNPFSVFPTVALWLVWEQMMQEANFTCTDLRTEKFFHALTLPTAKPYTFPDEYRDARRLVAGWEHTGHFFRTDPFVVPGPFNYVAEAPFGVGEEVNLGAAPYSYTAPERGYYDVQISIIGHLFCTPRPIPGEVGLKLSLYLNGVEIANDEAQSENGVGHPALTVNKERLLLSAGDVLTTRVEGKEIETGGGGPLETEWYVGTRIPRPLVGPYVPFSGVERACRFAVTMRDEFPSLGTIRLSDWLPEMSQLALFKTVAAVLNLTVQTSPYDDHLTLTTGEQVLGNVAGAAVDWTALRDAAPAPAGLPDRNTAFRFGDFAQRNRWAWKPDDTEPRPKLPKGAATPLYYGDGELLINDTTLPAEFTMVELPFAATFDSKRQQGFVRILGYEATEQSTPAAPDYSTLDPEPRLLLRPPDAPTISGHLIIAPYQAAGNGLPELAELTIPFSSSLEFFIDGTRPFDLSAQTTILPTFWADTAATLKEARLLTERYRLRQTDILALDFSRPIWDGILGDYFLLNKVAEYSADEACEVELVRLHSTLLPPPLVGDGQEFWNREFEGNLEFY